MALFDSTDLTGYLHYEVSAADAQVAERMVWGWLKGPIGATERPDPVPEELWSWAVELGALLHDNPRALTSENAEGDYGAGFALARRREILDAAREWGAREKSGPRGSFPAAQPWPDPLRPLRRCGT